MKIAVYSDIHSNLGAFEAVLKDLNRQKVDMKIFLGDIVGYGPNPNECIDLVKENADVILGGNHDWAAVGLTDTSYFNPFAKQSLDWTIENLTDENKKFLKSLKPELITEDYHLAHSSPLEPKAWHYMLSIQDAQDNYFHLKKDICFIGHSHQPIILEYVDQKNILPIRDLYKTLNDNRKYLVNVGSVGQPRDSNPDACYLTLNTKTRDVEYRRVEYDIKKCQKLMIKHNLPQYLIDRIAIGR
ncbi:MAG: metallophosphoesterase [bacterium]|nr:MAG: metallophosphoesterase [bacterium]